jgi:hypothetical protein
MQGKCESRGNFGQGSRQNTNTLLTHTLHLLILPHLHHELPSWLNPPSFTHLLFNHLYLHFSAPIVFRFVKVNYNPTRNSKQGAKNCHNISFSSLIPSSKEFHLVNLIDPTIARMDSDSTSSSSQAETASSGHTATTNTSQTTSSSVRSTISLQPTLRPKGFIPSNHSISKPVPSQTPPPSVIAHTPGSPSVSEHSDTILSSILSTSPSDTTITTQDDTPSHSHIKEDILLTMKYPPLR